jgi:hypothetical protein
MAVMYVCMVYSIAFSVGGAAPRGRVLLLRPKRVRPPRRLPLRRHGHHPSLTLPTAPRSGPSLSSWSPRSSTSSSTAASGSSPRRRKKKPPSTP